ncbi:hypothetical protein [Neobacillus sp. PS3-40]|nr:hypothetical protein [Neobacillus sp. PS3-40]WML43457.1 hypothetical protein RCG20_16915 [Neobacillus sp. PS3-40]
MENVLEIQNVTKRFTNGRGIENINLLEPFWFSSSLYFKKYLFKCIL